MIKRMGKLVDQGGIGEGLHRLELDRPLRGESSFLAQESTYRRVLFRSEASNIYCKSGCRAPITMFRP